MKASSVLAVNEIDSIIGKQVFTYAKEPILDENDDAIRAMIALSLGCDVIPGSGISGVGTSTLVDLFTKLRQMVYIKNII